MNSCDVRRGVARYVGSVTYRVNLSRRGRRPLLYGTSYSVRHSEACILHLSMFVERTIGYFAYAACLRCVLNMP